MSEAVIQRGRKALNLGTRWSGSFTKHKMLECSWTSPEPATFSVYCLAQSINRPARNSRCTRRSRVGGGSLNSYQSPITTTTRADRPCVRISFGGVPCLPTPMFTSQHTLEDQNTLSAYRQVRGATHKRLKHAIFAR